MIEKTQQDSHLNGPEVENALSGVLDSLNGRPRRQSLEGFEHLEKLLPRDSIGDPRRDIELMPDR